MNLINHKPLWLEKNAKSIFNQDVFKDCVLKPQMIGLQIEDGQLISVTQSNSISLCFTINSLSLVQND